MTDLPLRHPVYRTVLAFDVEGSTGRNNRGKAFLREQVFQVVTTALRACGIGERDCDAVVHRGDGVLVLVHPIDHAPKTVLLGWVVPAVRRLLDAHNRRRPEDAVRLRAVLHAGEIAHDRHGTFGETLDVAFRLLDAPEVKRALRETAAPLVLVVSDDVHRSVVRHGYAGITSREFRRAVAVEVGGSCWSGWLHEPGGSPLPRPPAPESIVSRGTDSAVGDGEWGVVGDVWLGGGAAFAGGGAAFAGGGAAFVGDGAAFAGGGGPGADGVGAAPGGVVTFPSVGSPS
ncbi:hypothetical protein AB0A74_19460 [Saccharothrix sp. NPDC042600]|uniref:hypothetical protein n=1 Tax=Saccharothrix TaxID=2071 RepID=UPI0033E19B0A|nr:hypothetical protein GCM10017745_85250 [Saccharothrix mutabilis subsp. capreolus]